MSDTDVWTQLAELSPEEVSVFLESDAGFHSDAAGQRIVREMIAGLRLKETDSVLDVGCGAGFVTVEVAKVVKAGKVTALDVAPNVAELARARVREAGLSNVEVVVADARKTGLPDRSFDGVLMLEVLNHVGPMDAVLTEARRLLKPGGRIALTHAGPLFAQFPEAHIFHMAIGHFQTQSHDSLACAHQEAALKKAGFREVETRQYAIGTQDVNEHFWWKTIESAAMAAVQLEAISQDQAEEWLTAISDAGKRSECLIGSTHFTTFATAPGIALRRS